MKGAVVRAPPVLGVGRRAALGLCCWEGTISLRPIFTPRRLCASSVSAEQTNHPLQNLNQPRKILERIASALGVVEVYS